MRQAEHKLLQISYGAGAHTEGLGCLRWTILEVKISFFEKGKNLLSF